MNKKSFPLNAEDSGYLMAAQLSIFIRMHEESSSEGFYFTDMYFLVITFSYLYHFQEIYQAGQEVRDVRLVRSLSQVVEDHVDDLLLVLKRRSSQNQQLCQLSRSQQSENLKLDRGEARKHSWTKTAVVHTNEQKPSCPQSVELTGWNCGLSFSSSLTDSSLEKTPRFSFNQSALLLVMQAAPESTAEG